MLKPSKPDDQRSPSKETGKERGLAKQVTDELRAIGNLVSSILGPRKKTTPSSSLKTSSRDPRHTTTSGRIPVAASPTPVPVLVIPAERTVPTPELTLPPREPEPGMYREIDEDPMLSSVYQEVEGAIRSEIRRWMDGELGEEKVIVNETPVEPEEKISEENKRADLNVLTIIRKLLSQIKLLSKSEEIPADKRHLIPILLYRCIEEIAESGVNYFREKDNKNAYCLSENQAWTSVHWVIRMIARSKPEHQEEIMRIAGICPDFKSLLYFAKKLIQAPTDSAAFQKYLTHRDVTSIYTDEQKKFLERLQVRFPPQKDPQFPDGFPVDNLRIRQLSEQITVDIIDPYLSNEKNLNVAKFISFLQQFGLYEEDGRAKEEKEAKSSLNLIMPIRDFIQHQVKGTDLQHELLVVLSSMNDPHEQGEFMSAVIRIMRNTTVTDPMSWTEEEVETSNAAFVRSKLSDLGTTIRGIVLEWFSPDLQLTEKDNLVRKYQDLCYQYAITGRFVDIGTELKTAFQRELETYLFLAELYSEMPLETIASHETQRLLQERYRMEVSAASESTKKDRILHQLQGQYKEEIGRITKLEQVRLHPNFIAVIVEQIPEQFVRIHLWRELETRRDEKDVLSFLAVTIVNGWLSAQTHTQSQSEEERQKKDAYAALATELKLEISDANASNIREVIEDARLKVVLEDTRIAETHARKQAIQLVSPPPEEAVEASTKTQWIQAIDPDNHFQVGVPGCTSEEELELEKEAPIDQEIPFQLGNVAYKLRVENQRVQIYRLPGEVRDEGKQEDEVRAKGMRFGASGRAVQILIEGQTIRVMKVQPPRINLVSQVELVRNGAIMVEIHLKSQGARQTESSIFHQRLTLHESDMAHTSNGELDVPASQAKLKQMSGLIQSGMDVLAKSTRDVLLALEKPLTSLQIPNEPLPYIPPTSEQLPVLTDLLANPPTMNDIQQAMKNLKALEKTNKQLEGPFFRAFMERVIAIRSKTNPDTIAKLPPAFKLNITGLSPEELQQKAPDEVNRLVLQRLPKVSEDEGIALAEIAFIYNGLVTTCLNPWIKGKTAQQEYLEATGRELEVAAQSVA